MSADRKLGLDDAYSVETPEDNIRLYGDWAATYESEFVADQGYVGYLRVVEQLAKHLADRNSAILDVGCGTGVCGVALRRLGFGIVDGIDISDAMLAEAAEKRAGDGDPVYRTLRQADLTRSVALPDDSYAGMVSAGTFTHGHLGPAPLDELWRIAAPGAVCAIGVNANHYKEAGFAAKIAADDDRGVISLLDVVEFETYTTPQADVTDGNDRGKVIVCRVNACASAQS